jgi:hypothetical protein
MTVAERAPGIFALSRCLRVGSVTALKPSFVT